MNSATMPWLFLIMKIYLGGGTESFKIQQKGRVKKGHAGGRLITCDPYFPKKYWTFINSSGFRIQKTNYAWLWLHQNHQTNPRKNNSFLEHAMFGNIRKWKPDVCKRRVPVSFEFWNFEQCCKFEDTKRNSERLDIDDLKSGNVFENATPFKLHF